MSEELHREPTPAEKIAAKAEELRAAAEDMEEAARRAGIEPDMPLAVWIRSIRVTLQHNAELAELHAQGIDGTIAGVLNVAWAETTRLQAAVTMSEAQTRKIEASVGSIDIRTHNLVAQTIDRMAAEVASKMRERMVIVEERHNRFVLWRTGALIALALLGTFGGGYGWRAYADREATALMERCMDSPFEDRTTGQIFCQLGGTPPP